jgi:hypothetical protein
LIVGIRIENEHGKYNGHENFEELGHKSQYQRYSDSVGDSFVEMEVR